MLQEDARARELEASQRAHADAKAARQKKAAGAEVSEVQILSCLS